jgi:hypothetical protein
MTWIDWAGVYVLREADQRPCQSIYNQGLLQNLNLEVIKIQICLLASFFWNHWPITKRLRTLICGDKLPT